MTVHTAHLKFPEGHNVREISFKTGLFINGEFVSGEGGKTIDVINPTTGKIIAQVSEASANDVDRAVDAAARAFKNVWGEKVPGHQRGKLLLQLAALFEEHADVVASIESLDNGKAYSFAKGVDLAASADCLRYYAGWADKDHGKVIEVDDSKLAYARHEPIGVVGQIIPWNFPILMFACKIAPALATGNCIVIKVAETTPLSALYAATLIGQVFPPGVVNILTGYGNIAGAAISSHMRINKVAFTGSTAVGRTIMKAAASSNLKSVTLELGGKSPNIIFEDADLEQAVSWAAFGVFFNHGQACTAGSRVYVQEGIYDQFLALLTDKVNTIKIGDPFQGETFQGPQASEIQYERIMSHIKSGKEEGATVHMGGERYGTEGYFIQPTIFTHVKPHMRIVKEEIFGPVVVVSKFKDEADVIEQANDTMYGLAAAVHTRDITRAISTAHKLQAGTVWVNCYNQFNVQIPFGGYKQSGFGREFGEDALRNYTLVKAIHVNLRAPGPL